MDAQNGLTVTSRTAGVQQSSGRLNIAAANFNAADDVDLSSAQNVFSTPINLEGRNVSVEASGSLEIGNVSASQAASFTSQGAVNLRGDIDTGALSARSVASSVLLGNVSSRSTMNLDAAQAIAFEGTVRVANSLNAKAGFGISQTQASRLSVVSGPSTLTVLDGDVALTDQSSIAGLVIDDDKMRFARTGGSMGAIRDYMFVSSRLAASNFYTSASRKRISSDDVMAPQQRQITRELPSVLNERDDQKLESVSIGPTGRIFKMASSDQVTQVSDSDGNAVSDVTVLISPEFLDKGDVVILDGGISTPNMFVISDNLQEDSEIARIAL
ncbi:hypothetical protein N9M50_04410 [Alphaproteobacteria bacterium]|nr:hypothetical protein [Alphaproteobacteria bacterium]